MTTQMIVRLDPELKNKVTRFAKAEGKNVSLLVRELLEDYVKNRDMGGYIDDLWDRIGKTIRKRGFHSDDIAAVIEDVRSGK